MMLVTQLVMAGEIISDPRGLQVPATAKVKYTSALWAARLGNVDKAISLLNDITIDHPNFARAYTNLGLLHLQENELNTAEQSLIRSIQLYPEDAIAYNHLGVVLRRLGKFKQAEKAYTKSIELDNQYAEAILNRGILYDMYLHDLPAAVESYRKYQELQTEEDDTVAKWIIDLDRRIQRNEKIQSKDD